MLCAVRQEGETADLGLLPVLRPLPGASPGEGRGARHGSGGLRGPPRVRALRGRASGAQRVSDTRRIVEARSFGAQRLEVPIPSWWATERAPVIAAAKHALNRLGDRQGDASCGCVVVRTRAVWCMHHAQAQMPKLLLVALVAQRTSLRWLR